MWIDDREHREAEATAWLRDGTSVRIRAATHEAIGIEMPSSAGLRRGLATEVSVGDSHRLVGPLDARVTQLARQDDGTTLAVLRFGAMSTERRRQLAALLMSWPVQTRALPALPGLAARRIEDASRIEMLLAALAAEERPGLVRASLDGPYSQARVRADDYDRASDLPVRWVVEGTLPKDPFVIEVAVRDFLYVVPVVRARRAEDALYSELPDEILRLPLASTWLAAVPPGSRWDLEREGAPRPVLRASGRRVAFALRPGERPAPHERFETMLQDDAGASIAGAAEVETTWPSPAGAEQLCTVRFEPRTEADAARWEAALERLHNPHTRRAGTWATSLWELYDKSGYFQLSGKTTAHFSRLRQPFAVATRRLDTAPEIGCHVVWPSRDRVEAALSILLVYSGTAMVYQVARRRDDDSPAAARQMLRAINFHAFEHLQRDPAYDWTLVYVQEGGARWSHLAYQTFTEAHLATGLTCLVRFRAMESVRSAPAHAPGHVRVAPARDEETALLAALLPSIRPQPYLEALDLVPERMDLGGVRRRWARAGFAREREVLVAHGPSGPLAAAVLESAQDALHLFGLLDCVRFFQLAPGGDEGFAALIEAARVWFRARDKETFVCFFEAENFESAGQKGLQDLGAANLMAFPRLLLPDFLEHLHLITAPRKRTH